MTFCFDVKVEKLAAHMNHATIAPLHYAVSDRICRSCRLASSRHLELDSILYNWEDMGHPAADDTPLPVTIGQAVREVRLRYSLKIHTSVSLTR